MVSPTRASCYSTDRPLSLVVVAQVHCQFHKSRVLHILKVCICLFEASLFQCNHTLSLQVAASDDTL